LELILCIRETFKYLPKNLLNYQKKRSSDHSTLGGWRSSANQLLLSASSTSSYASNDLPHIFTSLQNFGNNNKILQPHYFHLSTQITTKTNNLLNENKEK